MPITPEDFLTWSQQTTLLYHISLCCSMDDRLARLTSQYTRLLIIVNALLLSNINRGTSRVRLPPSSYNTASCLHTAETAQNTFPSMSLDNRAYAASEAFLRVYKATIIGQARQTATCVPHCLTFWSPTWDHSPIEHARCPNRVSTISAHQQ